MIIYIYIYIYICGQFSILCASSVNPMLCILSMVFLAEHNVFKYDCKFAATWLNMNAIFKQMDTCIRL